MAIGSGTTARGYRYLLPGEAPDLAGITQQQANDVDADMTKAAAAIRFVTVNLNISSGSNSGTNTSVALGRTYTTPPRVVPTIVGHLFAAVTVDNSAGTTSACSLRVFRPDGSNASALTTVPLLLTIYDQTWFTG